MTANIRTIGALATSAAVCAVLSLSAPVTVSAQSPSLEDVLSRASDYVGDFVAKLGGVVAEERYLQDVIPATNGAGITTRGPQGALPGAANMRREHRELKSDLLLVHPIGADRWVQFRDVFEVDGNPVRERDNRLAKLFLKPATSMGAEVKAIQEESARYNIGNLQRDINVPVLALVFFESDIQPRFEFTRAVVPVRAKPGPPEGMPPGATFTVSPDAWEVQYKEVRPSTMIRTTGDRDLPAHGRFWIEPATGRVLMSELVLDDPFVHGAIDVAYRPDPKLGLLTPIAMHEEYVIRSTGVRIQGTATYSKFRTFQVNTDEQMMPVK
jgi:hypothetical protein